MQSVSEYLSITCDGAIATISINRPAKRNAFNAAMWHALADLCEQIAKQAQVKVVVVRSATPGAFCAGADISEFEQFCNNKTLASENARLIRAVTTSLQELPRPTIACIEGDCFGGGTLLALACDFRIASSNARFAITPAKLGLSYTVVDTRILVQTVGMALARQLLLTGDVIDSNIAVQNSFVDEVVAVEALDARLRALVDTLCGNSQYSLRSLKRQLLRVSQGQVLDDEGSIKEFEDAFQGKDLQEGVAAFMGKRKASFRFE